MLLNNEQITKEIKICIETNVNKTQHPKPVEYCKSSAKGKIHNINSIPQETRKKSNK